MSTLAVVLSSGGLDSTTVLGLAVKRFGAENVVSVSTYYGQKHDVELKCARDVSEYYHVKHLELDLSEIFKFSNCPLLDKSTEKIEHLSYAEQIERDGEGMVRTYVPFRNGLLLSTVASVAMSLLEDSANDEALIMIGAHGDDSAGEAYADCSVEFIESMNKAIKIGTYNKVSVSAPFVKRTKADIVATGLELKVPYELTHSCYEGERPCCGTCGTCIDRINAFKKNNAVDPVPYKINIDWEKK